MLHNFVYSSSEFNLADLHSRFTYSARPEACKLKLNIFCNLNNESYTRLSLCRLMCIAARRGVGDGGEAWGAL